MVRRAYAQPASRSTGRAGVLLLASVLVGVAACGPPSGPRQPAVAAETLRWIALAQEQEQSREYHRARLLYLRAEREAPDDHSRGHAARSLGLALAFWGEYQAARRELELAVALRPRDVASWHDLGIIDHRLGDAEGAERAFRQSIALEPRDPRSRIALAALLWKGRRFADAATEYRALLRLALPQRIREKVKWALAELARVPRERPTPAPAPAPAGP